MGFTHQPSRFSSGICTASELKGVMYNFVYPDPTKAYMYFDDFFKYTVGDWTVTTTEAGAGSATEAITNAAGGRLLLTNAAGDDDLDSLQLVGESFLLVAGKRAWFEAKLQVSDATQSDWLVGLAITDTAPLAHTDGIVFRKDDGDTNIDFATVMNSSGDTNAAIGTNADATDVILGFYFDGTDMEVYIDNSMVALNKAATIPTDEELRLTVHIQNGEAVAKTMSLDYILAAVER